MDTTADRDPDRSKAKRPRPGAARTDRLLGRLATRAVARWILIAALAVLLGFVVLAVALQARTFTIIQWITALAFTVPIAAALVALLWYGRILGGAVAERERAEEGFRTVAATMADGIVTIDENSRIQYVNEAAERMFGYRREELLGHELTMLMPESFRARHRKGIGRYLTTGKRAVAWESIQFQGRHKTGREIPLEISIGEHAVDGRRLFTGIVRDITERKRAVQALAESEAKFRGLITSAPDGIFVISPDATILDVNPAGETMIGRPKHEIVGRSLTEFIPPERVPFARQYFTDRVEGLRATELYEGTWITSSGGKVAVQLTSQVVRSPDADPYLVVLVRDVTDQRDMQRRLVESDRWASMGRLASFVAHEINTPLTNISLLAASVSRRVSDPEVLERLKKISTQGKIAANITTELLKFARPGSINPVETDLVALVREAIDHAEAFRKPDTTLEAPLPDRPIVCSLDAIRIQEVVVNLLKNAYEATPDGKVTVRLNERRDAAVVSVTDTGTGIPREVQARLFEAFFTTKKKGEGTGLGLAISRNFVVSHGGDILVSSEPGRGSTFTVVLPRRQVGDRSD